MNKDLTELSTEDPKSILSGGKVETPVVGVENRPDPTYYCNFFLIN